MKSILYLTTLLFGINIVDAATTCKVGSASVSLTTGLPILQQGQTDWGIAGACNTDSTVCRNRFVITKTEDSLGRTLFAECVNAIDCTVGFKNESVSFARWSWTQTKCCDSDLCNADPAYINISWTGGSAPTQSGGVTTAPPTGSTTTTPPTVAPTARSQCTIVRESSTPSSCIADDCGYKCSSSFVISTVGTSATVTPVGTVVGCPCAASTGTISAAGNSMTGTVDGAGAFSATVNNNKLVSVIGTCSYTYRFSEGSCLGAQATSAATTNTPTMCIVSFIMAIAALVRV